jgi:hypothetical protein
VAHLQQALSRRGRRRLSSRRRRPRPVPSRGRGWGFRNKSRDRCSIHGPRAGGISRPAAGRTVAPHLRNATPDAGVDRRALGRSAIAGVVRSRIRAFARQQRTGGLVSRRLTRCRAFASRRAVR